MDEIVLTESQSLRQKLCTEENTAILERVGSLIKLPEMSEKKLPGQAILESGTLWARLNESTQRALACGALKPIPTECEFVEDTGIRFAVRILTNLKHKQEKQTTSCGEGNPFLPYDEDLFVADISISHVGLLNKFNVVPYHLLMVTRSFEDQETLLTLEDFEAIWICLAEFEGLAFYNAGKIAGASQRHKHLQFIPLPLMPGGPKVPIAPIIESSALEEGIVTASAFPFVHAIARLETALVSPAVAAQKTFGYYAKMLQMVGMNPICSKGERQSAPYNLLITRQWMLLVPRQLECFASISMNSLAFAGAFLVRDESEMALVKQHGPMAILKTVSVSMTNAIQEVL